MHPEEMRVTELDERLASRVPASLFGVVLGLAGLANAWRAAHTAWHLPAAIGETLFFAAVAAWLAVTSLYVLKWFQATDLALAESEHPVQCCFIGLAGVSTLLIAQGALSFSRALAIFLFVVGAAATLTFALWRTGRLWRGARSPASTTPVLYLPMVAGCFVSGTVASNLGWQDWGQLFFGGGFFAWLAIESVLLHRLYTGETLPPALRPTLGIQLAPPAVGAVSYLSVGQGAPDLMAHAMIGYAILQALLLIRMSRWITEQGFSASYWAFTFGATALAAASIRLVPINGEGAMTAIAPAVFILTNSLVIGVATGTVRLILQGKLFPPPFASTLHDTQKCNHNGEMR
ncbi:dicarboxylate transporter/tellurite-resistance protein TehA (plasmid) [Novosphingobium sp. P6W]|nr:dicarboxylate transporter/tellurite-resistance protein TehA [Novosphingobium sp. P6W]